MESNAILPASAVWKGRLRVLEKETFVLSPDDLNEFLRNETLSPMGRTIHIKIDDYSGVENENNELKLYPLDKIDKYIITSTPTRIIISK